MRKSLSKHYLAPSGLPSHFKLTSVRLHMRRRPDVAARSLGHDQLFRTREIDTLNSCFCLVNPPVLSCQSLDAFGCTPRLQFGNSTLVVTILLVRPAETVPHPTATATATATSAIGLSNVPRNSQIQILRRVMPGIKQTHGGQSRIMLIGYCDVHERPTLSTTSSHC